MPALTTSPKDQHHAQLKRLELLCIGLLILVIVGGLIVGYEIRRNSIAASKAKAAIVASQTLTSPNAHLATVRSKLGFAVTFDTQQFIAEGLIAKPDTSYTTITGSKVLQANAYSSIVITPHVANQSTAEYSANSHLAVTTSIRKDFFDQERQKYGNLSDLDLAEKNFSPISDNLTSYKVTKKTTIMIGGVTYRKLEFDEQSQLLAKQASAIPPLKSYLYLTIQQHRPYAVTVTGLGEKSPALQALDSLIDRISYTTPDTDVQFSSMSIKGLKTDDNSSIQNSLWRYIFPVASAASNRTVQALTPNDLEAVKVVAANEPAVVQIFNGYCAIIGLHNGDTSVEFPQSCSISSGSGFLLSSNGYIGTNGHVISNPPADLVAGAWQSNDPVATRLIAKFFLGTNDDAKIDNFLAVAKQSQQAHDEVLYAIETLNAADFSVRNEKLQYAVKLGNKPIHINHNTASEGKFFTYDKNIVKAELRGVNYNVHDLYDDNGFSASDVAIMKVSGQNYPFIRMGSIQDLVQGDALTVIGYPGLADDNGITDSSDFSQATATKGIVSAIRDTKGNHKKLIQSDVSIDHGNSGGPAFNDQGDVIGLATYGISLPNSSGTFNYMRDIGDLKDLLHKEDISLPQSGPTRDLWIEGLNNFLSAHYDKAIKNFQAVLVIYPQHSLAQKYIDLSKQRIADGDSATNSTAIIIVGTATAVLATSSISLLFVIKYRHKTYRYQYPSTKTQLKNHNKSARRPERS